MAAVGERARWAFFRLRSMSPAEVGFRVEEALKRRVDGLTVQHRVPEVAPEVLSQPFPAWPFEPMALDRLDDAQRQQIREDVASIRSDRFSQLGVERPEGTRRAWYRDPVTRTEWPQTPFSLRLDLMHEHGGRDIKLVWELSRLQHLQILALGYRLFDDTAARDACVADLEAWLDDNPPFFGIHWVSGIELASRVMSLFVIAAYLGPLAFSAALQAKMWQSLAVHGFWLARYPSLYSSANNHRIAELSALWAIGSLAPNLPGAAAWRDEARVGLAVEAERQILADGVGAEQSPTYQAYSMEWLAAALQVGVRVGDPLAELVGQRLALGTRFLATLLDAAGNAPRIGDDDEGTVFRQRLRPEPIVLSVAGALAARFGEAPPVAWRPDVRAALLGAFPALPGASAPSAVFREGGYSIWRHQRPERVVVVDHGPLGHLAIAAHGHADALAVWVHLDGHPVLVDAGTWRYNGVDATRAWFRGTEAHNTVTVDGANQSDITGRFNWGRRATTRLARSELGERGVIEGTHDGYLPRGVIHRRTVYADAQGMRVCDDLEGAGVHSLGITWQFAPDLALIADDGHIMALRGQLPVARIIVEGLAAEIVTRADGVGPGQQSPAYNRLLPAPALVGHGEVTAPYRVVTTFTWL